MTNLEFAKKVAEYYNMDLYDGENFISAEIKTEKDLILISGRENNMFIFVDIHNQDEPKSLVQGLEYLKFSKVITGKIKSSDSVWESWKADVIGTLKF